MSTATKAAASKISLTGNQVHALSLIHSHGCSGSCVNS
jgi:hypothetical protein